MESLGAFPDGEWDSFSRIFLPEGLDFTLQYPGQCSIPNLEHEDGVNFIIPSNFCPAPEANLSLAEVNESLFHSLNALNSNLHYISQESSFFSNNFSGGSVFFPNPCQETHFFSDSNRIPAVENDSSMSMDICLGNANVYEKNTGSFFPVFPDHVMEENVYANEDVSNDKLGNLNDNQPAGNAFPAKELPLKRKFDVPEFHTGAGDHKFNTNSSENAKKKPQVSRDIEKSKKNAQSKKNQNLSRNGNDEESNGTGSDGQSSSSCNSEDYNASQETSGGATSDSKESPALNLNGKTRANRGSATDPQSLYARKRRERINERLRILQNLVPNGTKVDISTMLEEAVHYVEFLQLQIKLLSSDEMWMYAPIAYNGMDSGLNRKISPLQ